MVFKKIEKVEEEKKEEPKEESSAQELVEEVAEEEYLVVKDLPTQQVRQYKNEETGKLTNFSTVEESLTRIEKELQKLTGGL